LRNTGLVFVKMIWRIWNSVWTLKQWDSESHYTCQTCSCHSACCW